MRQEAWVLGFALAAALTNLAGALSDGLAATPLLGWNSWNSFHDNVNETLIKDTADLLVNLGLAGVGYSYVVIDGRPPHPAGCERPPSPAAGLVTSGRPAQMAGQCASARCRAPSRTTRRASRRASPRSQTTCTAKARLSGVLQAAAALRPAAPAEAARALAQA